MSEYTKRFLAVMAAVALFFATPAYLRAQHQGAQGKQFMQQGNGETHQGAFAVPGKSVQIEGIILKHDGNSLQVRDSRGGDHLVSLSGSTEIKEKKSNPFRGARTYTQQHLMQGMMVQVSGTGGDSGNIIANKIRFTNADLRVAEAIEQRVSPVEQNLYQTTTRLGQSEQNAQRMSGQLEELSAVANAARGGAKAAQESAEEAKDSAGRANAGVESANLRISNIDDYLVKGTVTVSFKVGSSLLSKEAQAELDKIAQDARNEKAYVIEVSGYASSEGQKTLNQRLSQSRADEVIRYIAENHDIPLRRFITPVGLGTTHPIADNTTRTGRQVNRRVEVKVLVSRGLTQSAATGGQF
jgi:outer membrane protein OmpA-like peptidoglycan-associated protein